MKGTYGKWNTLYGTLWMWSVRTSREQGGIRYVDCIYTIVLSILLHVIFTRNERTKCYYKILTTCIVCIVSWYDAPRTVSRPAPPCVFEQYRLQGITHTELKTYTHRLAYTITVPPDTQTPTLRSTVVSTGLRSGTGTCTYMYHYHNTTYM